MVRQQLSFQFKSFVSSFRLQVLRAVNFDFLFGGKAPKDVHGGCVCVPVCMPVLMCVCVWVYVCLSVYMLESNPEVSQTYMQ